ncbi:tyrosine-type recombinase/integrase [Sciscionella marina]|uniref:tyrosine-type recombinase/integrase n=1 Tax=Sciscionella marina TaxID=508770 RepID=UPI00036F9402|nr:tyrosine-type recombinase/integrase [Sciscionella marina]
MAWPEPTGNNSWRVRYRRTDDTIGSIPGFSTRKEAEDYIADMGSEQRKGTWIDPAGGKTLVEDWSLPWLESLDIDRRTEDNYRSIITNHIDPKWGKHSLDQLSNLKIRAWEKHLLANGLATATVNSIIKCFSLLLDDAVDEKLIATNSIQRRRRGKRRRTRRAPRKVWPYPSEVLDIADQIAYYYGPAGAALVVHAAWTGARWGENVGLQRINTHLFDDDTGHMTVDPEIGALHELDDGRLYLGPPKTEESARTISYPPFLVRLLRAHLQSHTHRHVFTTPQHTLHRRSNFRRRAFRPCVEGNPHVTNPELRVQPVKSGLTFHGLRHGHKTWLIEDGVPEIAQALRLGHVLPDKVQQTYSHVANTVEQRLLDVLQTRWEKAVASSATPDEYTAWRANA